MLVPKSNFPDLSNKSINKSGHITKGNDIKHI